MCFPRYSRVRAEDSSAEPPDQVMNMPDHRMSAVQFQDLYERLRKLGGWDQGDQRGALRHLTAERMVAAAAEFRLGQTVTMAAPLAGSAADNPEPGARRMKHLPAEPSDVAGLSFAEDQLVLSIHGNADSHIDALCHVSYGGTLYGGIAPTSVTSQGAAALSVDDVRDGIVGRGVLLDIPRLRGTTWLEPGDFVIADDLARAAEAQAVTITPGDVLFVRVGHRSRRDKLGPWDVADSRAGLHPEALAYLAEQQIAALGSDSNSDTAPSLVDDVAFPVHVLAINALGLHLLDYLQFEDLRAACETAGRWTFLTAIAPLRLPRATGSPVNPIAML
jgi:kynurenine formamidase